jgi:hypothetical protein
MAAQRRPHRQRREQLHARRVAYHEAGHAAVTRWHDFGIARIDTVISGVYVAPSTMG